MRAALLRSLAAGCVLAALYSGAAYAKKPFQVDVNVGGQVAPPAEFTSIGESVDYLDPDRLSARFPNGDRADVAAALDFRGIDVMLTFQQDSGLLDFSVPLLGFTRQTPFGRSCDPQLPGDCSAARREALRELRDFLQSNPAFLKRLLTALVRFSPIDPLAGNPDSLFSRRQRGDFQHGFTNKVSQIWGCGTSAFNFDADAPIQVAAVGGVSDIFADAQARAAQLQAQNEIGVGLSASSTTASSTDGDYTTTAFDLPLSYTVKLDSDPRKKIRIDLPLSYADTEGAASYGAALGLAYTHPLSDDWSLTPAVGVGAMGSDDLGSAGGVSSFSLTSAYTWRFDSFALSMGNGVGRYDALGLKIGDVEAEADISNTVFTNGFLLTGPNSLIAKNLVIEYSFVDTRITGDDVYTDSYDEIGIALGHINTTMGVIDSYTKVGLSYLLAQGDFDDISSLRLNLSARF